MPKVYIVHHMYHEQDAAAEYVYDSDVVVKVFDSEIKAVQYIYDRVKNDQECADERYPGEDIIKYEPNMYAISSDGVVESLLRYCGDLNIFEYYRYESCELE